MKFGNFELFVISDGLFKLDGGAMFGVVPKALWQKTDPADNSNRILLGLNCLLIKSKSEVILLDTGIGTIYDEKFADIYGVDKSGGDLLQSLDSIGVKPRDVTKVILTHLHFDHCGGNCFKNEEGKLVPTFPEATYFVQKGELEYAKNPDPRNKNSYLGHTWEPLEVAGQLELISGDQELLSGIEVHVTGGHTRDHQIVKVHSGSKTACFLADLVPTTSHLKTPYVMAYDLYPKVTMEVKERVLKEALEENWLLIFEHAPNVKAGYLYELEGKLQIEKVVM